ncbi:Rpn family recombination-promoting nuclease/putative transposase [Desulfofundulus sp. TPOSR]|uniref:Rpn family recombination-promoting nuclease/putative transposase n=1 Tax=Desulfofundulus sp. TPOSR TaxID=2714340 RepID=UPI001409E8B1|nr:Rpn family recombination-promoting nuclease/putative transposase [Desulfofundulus sp. TPOSR]NHM28953.1 Rpn family recombination-promoting nuclease/putative transposase [Desulfofundulus sp. TPOSR]
MILQEYDLIIKALVERYSSHFVQLVRGIPADRVERLEKEAVAVKRESDVLLNVCEDGYEYIMLIEIQTRPDREMPLRLLEYTAMQHREYRKPVYPVVLNLTGRPQEGEYGFDCLDLTVIAFSYRVINLADLPAEDVLRYGPVGIVPLVPLMRRQMPDEELVASCARRIREAPAEWVPDLYVGLALFAHLGKIPDEIILRNIEVSRMEASPLFEGIRQKWVNEGIQKGIQEGIQKGSREDRIEAILEVLEENTGRYPGELAVKLRAIEDMNTLKMLFRRAVRVKSLEEFQAVLSDVLPSAN